ncbi:hypothetical protein C7435_0278 [Maricaulis maris]|uniref:Uncharacterized protein n=1 Tax=Maricaulis maris TaxID=74318 RepID=A0A495DLM8_9PROT|nr:hypothetical protein C7435_0278 [Maricaulis maris]
MMRIESRGACAIKIYYRSGNNSGARNFYKFTWHYAYARCELCNIDVDLICNYLKTVE